MANGDFPPPTHKKAVMQSDAEIVRQVREGNRQAYGILVERYERLVRATAMRLCGDRHAAEDVSQEAFIFGLKQLGSLREPAKFGGWILTITARTAARSKSRSRRAPVLVGDPDALPCGSGAALSRQSQELLELLDRLPKHEQSVIALRYFNGHTVREVADITGRPVGTITKQLSRACQRLRNWLQKEVTR